MAKKILVILKEVAIGLCVTAAAVASAVGLGLLVKHKKSNAISGNFGFFVFVKGKNGKKQKINLSKITHNANRVEDCVRYDSSFSAAMITDKYKPLNAVVDFIKHLEGKDIIQIQQPISNVDEMIKALGNDFQVERVESVNRCCNKGVMRSDALDGQIRIFYDREDVYYKISYLDYIKKNANENRYHMLLKKGYTFSLISGTADVYNRTKLIYYQPDSSRGRIFLYDEKIFQDDFFSNCKNSVSEMYLVKKVK